MANKGQIALESVLLVGMSFVALVTVGAALQSRLGIWGLAAAEAGLVLLPAWLWAGLRQVDLGGARPRALTVFGAALAGLGAFWLMAIVEQHLLERWMPTPPALRAQLEQLLRPKEGLRPLAADLLALAIFPAIAEETLFRGAVLAAFAAPRRHAPAILIAALLFAAFHASPYRLVAPALYGVLLGLLRVLGGSLWPPIAFHAANNVAVIALTRAGHDRVPDPRTATGALFAAAAIAALAAGFLPLLTRRTPRS